MAGTHMSPSVDVLIWSAAVFCVLILSQIEFIEEFAAEIICIIIVP